MSRVEIYRLKNDGSQEIIASGKLTPENNVEFEGNENFINQITRRGVRDKSSQPPVKVFPNEGQKFIDALKGSMNTGYITVKEIPNEENERSGISYSTSSL